MILISGTPGTGKHTVGRILAHKLGYRFIDLNKEIGKKEVSVEELNRFAKRIGDDNTVLVSHLAHFITSTSAELVIVLRCKPEVLIKRLKKRGYGRQKLYDNAMFEALDGTYAEAVGMHKNVLQLDNTKNIKKTVNKILRATKKKEESDEVDYTASILKVEKWFRTGSTIH